jgi:phosphatidylglycerol---prolipoprotein diacylglyceryl transferase
VAFVFARVDQVPRPPSQLYEALFYFGISIALFFPWKLKKFSNHDGFIAGLGVTIIFLQRFLMEFLKENQVSFEENVTLNMGQFLSIPLILGGIALMIMSMARANKTVSN